VNLEAGRQMARLCAEVRSIRKVKTIAERKPETSIDRDIKIIDAAQRAGVLPTKPSVDEGRMLNKSDADALHAKLKSLPPADRTTALEWFAQAQAAGRPLKFTDNPTQRRIAIATAVVEWVGEGEEKMRNAIALVLGADQVQPTFTTGALLSLLTIEEAECLVGL